ncbi:MAG: hypothetical protein KAI64_05960 [Thermoplasmata archaeon]|nr:hypothetical protein [Thermoplasmata archaeon]
MIYVKVESIIDERTVLFPADGVFHEHYNIVKPLDESGIKVRCRRDYEVPFGIRDDDYPYSVIHIRIIGVGDETVVNGRIIEDRKMNALDLIFQNVRVYIMNEEGQTIDTVIQSNDHTKPKTGPTTNRLQDMDILDYEFEAERGVVEPRD